MRIKLVKSLRGGEILAEPVITEEKEVLITAGTVLKPEYLDLLSFLGIDTVSIEDPYAAFEHPHQFMRNDKLAEFIGHVKKILENHTYDGKEELKNIVPLGKSIMDELVDADENIVFDIAERNGNLYEHTIMVTLLAVMVAKKLKLKEEQITDLTVGCLLHDLGLRYITVPYVNQDIENGAASEAFEFKKHTILAYSALESETWLKSNVKKMILTHHERKDGSGFPLRQKTKEIECNILQVCDVFDCLVSGMECKRINVQSALEYLVETADILFEKKVVRIIEKMVARYPVGTKVKLSTGENGIVIEQTDDSIHPIIAALDEEDKISGTEYNLQKNKKVIILEILD